MEGDIYGHFGLSREPFADSPVPALFFPGEQQLRALEFMREFLWSKDNVAVITAPRGSGKTILIRRFLDELDERVFAAELHSPELDRRRFLKEMLSQYGLELDDEDADLRHLLRTFLQHQRSMGRVCLLVLENAQSMPAVVLDELTQLARLEFDRERVLKVLLVGTDALHRVVRSPGMSSFLPRDVPTLAIAPLAPAEVGAYVVHRLRAAGAIEPSTLIDEAAVHRLAQLSGGVPEAIDEICRSAFAHLAADGDIALGIDHLRLAAEELGLEWREQIDAIEPKAKRAPLGPPRLGEAVLKVSIQGQQERELRFDIPRMLIGRSQSADVRIHSMYVSRHHALLVRERDYDVVIDLGSTNGVLVNSERISHHALTDRDLIQIGPARMVYCCEGATGAGADDFGSTVRFARNGDDRPMETLERTPSDRVVGFGRPPRTNPGS